MFTVNIKYGFSAVRKHNRPHPCGAPIWPAWLRNQPAIYHRPGRADPRRCGSFVDRCGCEVADASGICRDHINQHNRMKIPVNTRKVVLLAAVALPIMSPLHAQQSSPIVGPRPPKAGDEKIIRSTSDGYLHVYRLRYRFIRFMTTIILACGRITTTASCRSREGVTEPRFDRRALALKPGVYDVEILYPSIDAVEPRDENNYGKVRVSIKPGRITEVWLSEARIGQSSLIRPVPRWCRRTFTATSLATATSDRQALHVSFAMFHHRAPVSQGFDASAAKCREHLV